MNNKRRCDRMPILKKADFEINGTAVIARDITPDGLFISTNEVNTGIGSMISVAIKPELGKELKINIAAVVKHTAKDGFGVKINKTMTQMSHLNMFCSFVKSCRQQQL